MKSLLVAFILSSSLTAFGQFNPELKKQLDSVEVLDQKYRQILMDLYTSEAKKDSIAKVYSLSSDAVLKHFWTLQSRIDSSNLSFIEDVFKKYGYPGKSMVGEPTNEVGWIIIQHSEKIGDYIDLIKKAGEQKELPYTKVAMMEDRYLMDQGKEQIYGTQGASRVLKSSGKKEMFIWPIKNPEGVNERRKKAGFDTTVEEYLKKLLNVEYKVVKLEDIQSGS